jgi:hypothetical protein
MLGLPIPRCGDGARIKATVIGGRPVPLSWRAHVGTPRGVACSITVAEVEKKDRKQGPRKGDARVGHHGSGYKGPQGGLSTPMAFSTSPILPTSLLVSRGSRVGLTPCLGKANHSRRRYAVHLIMAREPCERATDWVPVAQLPMYTKNPSISPPSHAPGHKASQQPLPSVTSCLP